MNKIILHVIDRVIQSSGRDIKRGVSSAEVLCKHGGQIQSFTKNLHTLNTNAQYSQVRIRGGGGGWADPPFLESILKVVVTCTCANAQVISHIISFYSEPFYVDKTVDLPGIMSRVMKRRKPSTKRSAAKRSHADTLCNHHCIIYGLLRLCCVTINYMQTARLCNVSSVQ